MNLPRRRLLQLAASATALLPSRRAAGGIDYPIRPVHIVAGYPPGSSPDVVARLMGQWLSERLGQQFVVDNRPGAAGNFATQLAAKAPADGYTLLVTVSTNAINATLYPNLNVDFSKDLMPVVGLGHIPFIIVVNPVFPAKTVPELIAYAKAHPGKVDMATNGVGTGSHVSGELFMMMTETKLTHVPYKGNYLTDLIGGQVPLAFSPTASVIEHIKNGKLHAIGVSTAARSNALPDVPTIGEFVPGYGATGWYGLCAPNGTPAEIIDKLEKALLAGVADPTFRSRLASLGIERGSMTTAEFGKFITAEIEKWAKVIKFAGIKIE
jgi:tripartite-type tricarboxylate transporter receptor subunit TctC